MENKNLQIDESKLTPEQRDQLDSYYATQKQIKTLSDIASMLQEFLSDQSNDSAETNELQNIGTLLIDIRESLSEMKSKGETDTAKPFNDSIKGLEKAIVTAIAKIDVQPQFNPNITVDAPDVKVEASKIDTTGIEKAIATVNTAIKAIPASPAVNFTPLEKLLKQMSEQLSSIDTASRMKPQFPNTLRVTNPDGTTIGGAPTFTERYDYDDPTTIYIAEAVVGTSGASLGWTITKYDLTDTNNASGKIATDVSWDNRTAGGFA